MRRARTFASCIRNSCSIPPTFTNAKDLLKNSHQSTLIRLLEDNPSDTDAVTFTHWARVHELLEIEPTGQGGKPGAASYLGRHLRGVPAALEAHGPVDHNSPARFSHGITHHGAVHPGIRRMQVLGRRHPNSSTGRRSSRDRRRPVYADGRSDSRKPGSRACIAVVPFFLGRLPRNNGLRWRALTADVRLPLRPSSLIPYASDS